MGLGHLVMDCDDISKRTVIPSLPVQRYAHDPGCLDLRGAFNFIQILSTIRRHLHISSNTQNVYISIARDFQSRLPTASRDVLDHQCGKEDFLSFIINHWPTFRSFESAGNLSEVTWGRVQKKFGSLNEVAISNSLVSVAEMVSLSFYGSMEIIFN